MKRRAGKHQHLGEFSDGRDENNLAEFPVALLSDSVPEGQKTIEFQDTLKDWSTGQVITRRVCVTGSDKFGLPTAKDEDVLLALIQLTKLANNFTSAEVWFTKHEIIQILGWQNRGWAYDRVEESLHRWKGVSIHYWNAWRDNARGEWCDSEAIGVIEYVRITDGRRRDANDERHARSRFVWNQMLFASFQADYLKRLDFATYRKLKRPAARRAYRFLDKRFYHQPEWEFELREFACEKVGLSRNYDTGQLKEKLRPVLGELVNIGFVQPARYRKECPKVWKIAFTHCRPAALPAETALAPPPEALERLLKYGVAAATARELVAQFADRIAEKLALVDWLVARNDRRIQKNPAGFLVAAIRQDYPLPKDYLKTVKRTTKARGKVAKCSRSPKPRDPAVDTVGAFLRALPGEAIDRLEVAALVAATSLERASYERLKAQGGQLFLSLRESLLRKHIVTHGLATADTKADAA